MEDFLEVPVGHQSHDEVIVVVVFEQLKNVDYVWMVQLLEKRELVLIQL